MDEGERSTVETAVGVVGPHDLVETVAKICADQPGLTVHPLDYDHEDEASRIVSSHAADVDAWLFTGVVPYTLTLPTLTRPAAFVDYTSSSLLVALVRLLRQGMSVDRLSIDVLARRQVHETLTEAKLSTDQVETLPYKPGTTSTDMVAFHRGHAGNGRVAITCLSSVHETLSGEMPVVRLVPSWHSVRSALHQVLMSTTQQVHQHAQVALGLVSFSGPKELLDAHVLQLGGALAQHSRDTYLLVTTRGALAAATAGLTRLRMLAALAEGGQSVHVGFGLGQSVPEAERLARRALSRARTHGAVAGVICLRNDVDILLDSDAARRPETRDADGVGVLARRVGLSVQTVQRLQKISRNEDSSVTTRQVAELLGVQLRTARRMLQRLELAGLAERQGHQVSGYMGRPLTLYRMRL